MTVTCHCENVTLTFEALPASVRDCDCPICNRLGALWADYPAGHVTVRATRPTATYRWGDGANEMHRCPTCGCTTHYTAAEPSGSAAVGVNLRMLDRRQLELIPIQGAGPEA